MACGSSVALQMNSSLLVSVPLVIVTRSVLGCHCPMIFLGQTVRHLILIPNHHLSRAHTCVLRTAMLCVQRRVCWGVREGVEQAPRVCTSNKQMKIDMVL